MPKNILLSPARARVRAHTHSQELGLLAAQLEPLTLAWNARRDIIKKTSTCGYLLFRGFRARA